MRRGLRGRTKAAAKPFPAPEKTNWERGEPTAAPPTPKPSRLAPSPPQTLCKENAERGVQLQQENKIIKKRNKAEGYSQGRFHKQ